MMMEEYRKNINEMGEINDISYVRPNNERIEITALKSIKNSFFINIAVSLSRLIITLNLIILGHTLYDNNAHCNLFMIFQIGIFIVDVLGKFFILGLIKYLFEDKEEMEELYNLYIRMKTLLVILIPTFLGPVCLLLTYYLMGLLSKINLDIYDQALNKEVYFKYLIFAPVIYLFEILFLLNLQFLLFQKKIQEVFSYVLSFLIAHFSLSWILLYILEIDLIGLTFSYCLNTFLFYLFTNQYIKKLYEETSQNIFFLFPSKSNFDGEVFTLLKEKSILAFINIGDILFLHFLFFMTLFTDRNQLMVNIIYLNFYELICFINKGFYLSLKKYISTKIEEASKKQKYVAIFSFYFMILSLILFLILIIFKNILLDCYIFGRGVKNLIEISNKLRIYFPLCLLLNSIRMILNGINRGMNIPLPIVRKALYIAICIILSYIFCFTYEYGIYGLWISIFILNIFLILDIVYKAIDAFPKFFNNFI